MATFKTYHRRNFSHKKATWLGMDQGKGQLYRGDTVEFMLNALVDENTFKLREGQAVEDSSASGINAGKRTVNGTSIICGTNFFFDTSIPSVE